MFLLKTPRLSDRRGGVKNMEKGKFNFPKLFIIAFFLFLLAFSAIFVLVFRELKNKPLSPPKTPSDQKIMEEASLAIRAGDLKSCDSLDQIVDGVNYRTVCRNNIFSDLAEKNLDFKSCQELDNKLMMVEDCQRNVMALMIQKEKNLSVCDNADMPEKYKQSCPDIYWGLTAIEQNNPALCSKITVESGDFSCEQFIFQKAVFSEQGGQTNVIDCSLFKNSSVKNDCLNYKKRNK